MEPKAVEFVKAFFEGGIPVAAICHGPWTIIEAGMANGRKIASWPSLTTDLKNAGAEWIDGEAVIDGKLVSARKPDDIPAFNRAMLEVFGDSQAKSQQSRLISVALKDAVFVLIMTVAILLWCGRRTSRISLKSPASTGCSALSTTPGYTGARVPTRTSGINGAVA